jgi:uncharacterized protein YjiS (DUF1127 family)
LLKTANKASKTMNAQTNTLGAYDMAADSLSRAAAIKANDDHPLYGVIGRIAAPLVHMVDGVVQRHQSRKNANALTRLDDAILKDIGISRGEILGIADELASGRSNGQRPIGVSSTRYRSNH